MGTFRVEFASDGREERFQADDFDDDGETITLFRFDPPGADPLAPGTSKVELASFHRGQLAGPPQRVD